MMLLSRSPSSFLRVGSFFALQVPGSLPKEQECLWQVRRIRDLLGIPHALIEQCATGKSKTVAISAIIRHPGFQAK